MTRGLRARDSFDLMTAGGGDNTNNNNNNDNNNNNNNGNENNDLKIGEKLIAGAIAGIIGTTVIFPLDSIKTRLQSGQYNFSGRLKGIYCAQHILKNEGTSGFYRGLTANLIGVTPEKAIKLAVNDTCRAFFSNKLNIKSEQLPTIYGLISGATAGLCQVIATNPMELVKIHMQLASSTSTNITKRPSLVQVVKGLGLRGIYRGTTSTLCRDVPFSILFFQTFAELKFLLRDQQQSSNPQFGMTLLAGMLAGGLSAFIATPMDVVKTRLQAPILLLEGGKDKTSMLDVYKSILKKDGIKGLFRGAIQRCFIVSPLFAVSLLVYEIHQYYLQ